MVKVPLDGRIIRAGSVALVVVATSVSIACASSNRSPAGFKTSPGKEQVGQPAEARNCFDASRTDQSDTARDDLTNGFLIGASVGLSVALAILAGVGSGEGYVLASARWGAPLLLSSIGGLIGALIDRADHSDPAPCPVDPASESSSAWR